MPANIGLYTYLIASFSYLVLGSLLLLHWRIKPTGPSLFIACLTTAIWAAVVAIGALSNNPPATLIRFTEILRNAAWIFFLLQILSLQTGDSAWRWHGKAWLPSLVAVTVGVIVFLLAFPALTARSDDLLFLYRDMLLVVMLAIPVLGLILIEQLYRNALETERWSVKYLCFALGITFAYDFFIYAEALLFRHLDDNLWQARGIVNTIVVPLLAIGIARNSAWRLDLRVSRQAVFHTVTLMGAGVYLLAMAIIGYFLKFMGGNWGGVLRIGFLAAAVILLLSLLFSGKLRAKIRVFLSKHFFSYRHDYREEWLKFTYSLASIDKDTRQDVAEGIVRSMAPLANSNAGLLWGRSADHDFEFLAHWQMPAPETTDNADLENLPSWLGRTDWVIDLNELRTNPDAYSELNLPAWLQSHSSLWLIIPLVFGDRLEGILMLTSSDLKSDIDWEDRDLLKTAGRQAATLLAQSLASHALVEARQFEAFNRLSAYVIHDLKNILAQQSLIVTNAARHRDNPAFIDDMIDTVSNSVDRMNRLMEQMRSGVRTSSHEALNLCPLLINAVDSRSGVAPKPEVEFYTDVCVVEADAERLTTVFNHLIQNAQEATPPQGSVNIRLQTKDQLAYVVVEDSGRGMDSDFIQNHLFQPFRSTKGLTGMGIGAFESREYIRQLGGDIVVASNPGAGSTFTIHIPLASASSMESTDTPVSETDNQSIQVTNHRPSEEKPA